MVRGSWSKPWHLNCSPCICLKAWDKKFFCIVFLWWRLQLLQISPFSSSLLLLLFAISSPYLRKLLSGPLLWVTDRARAVFQLSLDFPSPPLTSQRSIRVRKPLGRGKVEANPSVRVSKELCLWHEMNKPSANESRNSSWKGVHISSQPGKKVKQPWPNYAILVLASANLHISVNMKSEPW